MAFFNGLSPEIVSPEIVKISGLLFILSVNLKYRPAEPRGKPLERNSVFVLLNLGQYRTNELVRRRMNFSSDAMADFEGLLEVNRKICKQQMAEKASPTLPTNCAVLP